MIKFSNSRYKVDKKVQDFLTNHSDELSTIEEFENEKLNFNECVTLIEKAYQNQVKDIKAITANKNDKKKIMIAIIFKYMLRAFVKANQVKNTNLYKSFDKPISFFNRPNEILLLTRVNNMKKLMKDNLSVLTNINNSMILEMETAIKNFSKVRNSINDAIKYRKSQGTDTIIGLLNNADISKTNIGKLILSYLPELYSEWLNITKIGNPSGIRHLSFALHFRDFETNVLLKNIKCTITDGKTIIIRKSTRSGWIQLKSLENGNWSIYCEHPTYIPFEQTNIGIEQGKIIRIDIKLKKVQ